MVLHATRPEVRAVLDWELSTLGDPLADFSYYLMQWAMEGDSLRPGLASVDRKALGIPDVEDLVDRYCAATGRTGVPNLDWFFSYNLFRLAGICQGIAGRVRDGTAASPQAAQMGARVVPLAQNAWAFALKAGA
jgi:aminoglycoside phosphotransferase (APT) family kinase protein